MKTLKWRTSLGISFALVFGNILLIDSLLSVQISTARDYSLVGQGRPSILGHIPKFTGATGNGPTPLYQILAQKGLQSAREAEREASCLGCKGCPTNTRNLRPVSPQEMARAQAAKAILVPMCAGCHGTGQGELTMTEEN